MEESWGSGHDAQAAAQAKGRERYDGFIEALGRRLQKGQSILNEIPEDLAARSMLEPEHEPTSEN